MPHTAAARAATRERDAGRYQCHRPEQTLLYRIVKEYYSAFTAHLAEQGRELPGYVHREFEDYVKCGRLEQEKRVHIYLTAHQVDFSLPRPCRSTLSPIRCSISSTKRWLPVSWLRDHAERSNAISSSDAPCRTDV